MRKVRTSEPLSRRLDAPGLQRPWPVLPPGTGCAARHSAKALRSDRATWAGAGRPRAPVSMAGSASGHRLCGPSLGQSATVTRPAWASPVLPQGTGVAVCRSATEPRSDMACPRAGGRVRSATRPVREPAQPGKTPGSRSHSPGLQTKRLAGHVVAACQASGLVAAPPSGCGKVPAGRAPGPPGSGQLHLRSLRRS